jgi:hypothetical protein
MSRSTEVGGPIVRLKSDAFLDDWIMPFFPVVAPLWHFGCFNPKRRDATFEICVPHAYFVVAIGGLEPPTSRL